jgi:hypothetical protein
MNTPEQKARQRDRQKAWRATRTPEQKAATKAFNAAAAREARLTWTPEKKAALEAKNREWREAHRDEVRAQRKSWREAHKEERNAYAKTYYVTHRAEQKANMRKYLYDLTPDQYATAVAAQGGLCAFDGCSRPAIHVDHDHDSGEFRGLLCGQHNMGLGLLGDTLAGLRAGVTYLERFETRNEEAA